MSGGHPPGLSEDLRRRVMIHRVILRVSHRGMILSVIGRFLGARLCIMA
jgi:hypothetical protein